MSLFADTLAWMVASAASIGQATVVHLLLTFAAVLIACLVAVPAGLAIGHTGRGREVAVVIAGAARALPSFGLILLLVLVMGVFHKLEAAVAAFVVLAIPSILAGAYAGIEAIDRRVIDAARSVGMSDWQLLWRVEVPLGLQLLVSGVRSGTLQVVATVTIAAYVNLGGLGQYIITGIQLRQYDMILGGALLVTALALVLDGLFALAQRAVSPRGIRAARPASPIKERTQWSEHVHASPHSQSPSPPHSPSV